MNKEPMLAQGPVDVNVSQMATESGTPQYYYKDNACKANTAHDADCICWHDEGTGPYDSKRHDDDDEYKFLTWRVKPSNANITGLAPKQETTK